MAKDKETFSKGDWIIHRQYGVGQIVGIEKKRLNRKTKRFYKVKTKNSTFWLPVEKAVNSRVNPLPSKQKIKQALAVLKKPARKMSKDVKQRQKRIKKVRSEGSLVATAKLVRDLTARRSESRLNTTEQRALERLTNRFLELLSIRMGLDEVKARRKLHYWITGETEDGDAQDQTSTLNNMKFPSGWRRKSAKITR